MRNWYPEWLETEIKVQVESDRKFEWTKRVAVLYPYEFKPSKPPTRAEVYYSAIEDELVEISFFNSVDMAIIHMLIDGVVVSQFIEYDIIDGILDECDFIGVV